MAPKSEKTGDRLTAMMAARNPPVRQAMLARDMGLTPTSIFRYIKALNDGSIDDGVWAQLAELLKTKYGIDVTPLRPVRAAVTLDTSLVPLLDAFEKGQLEALAKILEGPRQARDTVLVLARDRLSRR